jgi:hypothetical protein
MPDAGKHAEFAKSFRGRQVSCHVPITAEQERDLPRQVLRQSYALHLHPRV